LPARRSIDGFIARSFKKPIPIGARLVLVRSSWQAYCLDGNGIGWIASRRHRITAALEDAFSPRQDRRHSKAHHGDCRHASRCRNQAGITIPSFSSVSDANEIAINSETLRRLVARVNDDAAHHSREPDAPEHKESRCRIPSAAAYSPEQVRVFLVIKQCDHAPLAIRRRRREDVCRRFSRYLRTAIRRPPPNVRPPTPVFGRRRPGRPSHADGFFRVSTIAHYAPRTRTVPQSLDQTKTPFIAERSMNIPSSHRPGRTL